MASESGKEEERVRSCGYYLPTAAPFLLHALCRPCLPIRCAVSLAFAHIQVISLSLTDEGRRINIRSSTDHATQMGAKSRRPGLTMLGVIVHGFGMVGSTNGTHLHTTGLNRALVAKPNATRIKLLGLVASSPPQFLQVSNQGGDFCHGIRPLPNR